VTNCANDKLSTRGVSFKGQAHEILLFFFLLDRYEVPNRAGSGLFITLVENFRENLNFLLNLSRKRKLFAKTILGIKFFLENFRKFKNFQKTFAKNKNFYENFHENENFREPKFCEISRNVKKGFSFQP
jgi:hypothetical protein